MNISLASADHANVEEQNTRWLGSRKADLLAARGIRGVLIAIVAGILLGYLSPSHVFAKSGKQAGSDNAPAIDPSAMQALDKMGAYLRTLHSFQVKADMTTDDVLEDGEAIQSSSTVNLVASRPNRLRAEFVGDDGHRFFFFDGKNFTIYGQIANYYATVPAPPTITELIQKLGDKYAIQLPLVDLFEWGTTDSDINKIKAAQGRWPFSGRRSHLRAVCLPSGKRGLAGLDPNGRISIAAQDRHPHSYRRREAATHGGSQLESRAILQRRCVHLRSTARCKANQDRRGQRRVRRRKSIKEDP